MTRDQLPGTEALPRPEEADNIVYNPTQDQMRALSSELEEPTEYGSSSYVSEYRSRSSERTWNTVDRDGPVDGDASIEAALGTAGATILDAVEERELVVVDVRVGTDTEEATVGRYIVPQEYARIARSLTNLMEPVEGEEPDFYTVQLPGEADTEIIADPDSGGTLVRGSDYTGEAKKSFLRQFMYDAKEQGGLGIHAGSKRVAVEGDDGLQEIGQVYQGLSGTGKSTLTAHGFWLDDPEYAEMLQDDVCALMPDGSVRGSEGAGLYIKTAGIDPDEQPELYDVATDQEAVL